MFLVIRRADEGATLVVSRKAAIQRKAEGIPAPHSAPSSSMERLSMRRSIVAERGQSEYVDRHDPNGNDHLPVEMTSVNTRE